MKIIICEDESYWSNALRQAVSKWTTSKSIELAFSCFPSSQGLICHLEENSDSDILFLDLDLGEDTIDGMGLAERIRKMGLTIPIIFVTSNPLRAADGYLVEAVGYLEKPINEERLSLFLDRIYEQEHHHKTIMIMDGGHATNINLKDIVYAEVRDHTVIYFTVHGTVSCRGTFSDILKNLGNNGFVQIHRSFVVAFDKIGSINSKYPYSVDLKSNDEIVNLSVSRKYIDNLLEIFSENLLENMI